MEVWISLVDGSSHEVANIEARVLETRIAERWGGGDLFMRLDYFDRSTGGRTLVEGGLSVVLDHVVSIRLKEGGVSDG